MAWTPKPPPTWQPPPLTEADMVPDDWRIWWRWSSVTGLWTRHVRGQ